MFNNLKVEDDHWVASRTQMDTEDDPNQNARAGAFSPNIPGSRNFDPAVSRPVAAHAAASVIPPTSAPVTVTHTSVSHLTSEDVRHCKVCDVDLSGIEPAKQHYAGKQHNRMVQKALIAQQTQQGKVEMVALNCEVCVKSFTSEISARQHYASKGHQKALEGAAKWASSQRVANSNPPGPEERAALPPDGQPAFNAGAKPYSLFSEGRMDIRGVLDRSSEDEAKVTLRRAGAVTVSPADSTGGNSSHPDRAVSPPGLPSSSDAPGTPGRSSEAAGGPLPPPGLPIIAEGTKGNAADILRSQIISQSTAVLEERMKLIIPQIANQIADAIIAGLASGEPAKLLSDAGYFTASDRASSSPLSGRSAEKVASTANRDPRFLLPSSVHVSVPPSTISSAGSLRSSDPENDLSNVIQGGTLDYRKDWDTLVNKNRDGSP